VATERLSTACGGRAAHGICVVIPPRATAVLPWLLE